MNGPTGSSKSNLFNTVKTMSDEQFPIYSEMAGDEDFHEIVVLYVNEMSERIARFQKALAEKDWEDLRCATHQLKGSAGSHGFALLSTTAAEAEKAVREQWPEDKIADAVEKLVQTCRRVTSDPKPG